MLICHLTSVHPRYDTRIFIKQCRSLALSGYEVTLVVADDAPNEVVDGVRVLSVGGQKSRAERILHVTRRVFRKAVELDADLYHLHDPELLPIGLKLKRIGRRVIFDSHEDVPRQILGKHYLGRNSGRVLSMAVKAYETWVCRRLDAVVAATPFIRDKFLPINPCSVDVNNFPLLGELVVDVSDYDVSPDRLCYVGAITTARGIKEMVKAMELTPDNVRLQLGGTFGTESLANEVRSYSGWQYVDELGWLGREEIAKVLASSAAGLVVLHPTISYVDSLPVKMFEYMSAGIPVIASDFPLWRDIVEGNECGLCVDPQDPREIAEAITWIVHHPEEARAMGANGRRAVETKYNWGAEEEKLLSLYNHVLA